MEFSWYSIMIQLQVSDDCLSKQWRKCQMQQREPSLCVKRRTCGSIVWRCLKTSRVNLAFLRGGEKTAKGQIYPASFLNSIKQYHHSLKKRRQGGLMELPWWCVCVVIVQKAQAQFFEQPVFGILIKQKYWHQTMKYQYYTGLQLYFVLTLVHFSEKNQN